MTSWLETLECHVQHAAAFARHQAALVQFDPDLARVSLSRYDAALRAHMAVEEEVVLPLYQSRDGERPGGDLELFLFEHRKIRTCLDEFATRLATVSALGVEKRPAGIIGLLDRQCAFKTLMDHHDRRERTMLYPRLDELTTEEERSRLVPLLI